MGISLKITAVIRPQWEALGKPEVIAVREEVIVLPDGSEAIDTTVHAAPDDWDKPGTGYLWAYHPAKDFGLF